MARPCLTPHVWRPPSHSRSCLERRHRFSLRNRGEATTVRQTATSLEFGQGPIGLLNEIARPDFKTRECGRVVLIASWRLPYLR